MKVMFRSGQKTSLLLPSLGTGLQCSLEVRVHSFCGRSVQLFLRSKNLGATIKLGNFLLVGECKNITWVEAKDRCGKLQNFDIVVVYMGNKLHDAPTLSSCLPAGESSSFSFQEAGIAAT